MRQTSRQGKIRLQTQKDQLAVEQFDIELYKSKSEIIRQTVKQVQKDFGMFGFDITFSGNAEMAYEEMFRQLSAHLTQLIENDYHTLASLLYHIDLGEDKIAVASEQHPEWGIADIVTELVIHRELKKVLMRNYFRQKGTEL
jgi:hypothetical protein